MTMTLDELATSWLSRRPTIPAALPGLNNDLGAVQVEVDPVALKHPCFPPFSAGNEVTGLTLLNGRSVAQLAAVEVRWLAYRVDRRCTAAGWRLTSRTTLLADAPGAVVELTVVNTEAEARDLDLELMFSGRARNHGSDDYSWAIPSIPTDVFNFCNHRGLRQHPEPIADGAGVAIANEEGNAWSLAECSPKPAAWRVGRCPSWHQRLPSGGSFTITVLQVWHAERPAAEAELARWRGRWSDAFAQAQARWEALWRDAFTPGNPTFSGHLPALTSRHRPLEVLYHLGVLTLLTCRRRYRQLDGPSYLTLWPRRGEGSVYLAWDLAAMEPGKDFAELGYKADFTAKPSFWVYNQVLLKNDPRVKVFLTSAKGPVLVGWQLGKGRVACLLVDHRGKSGDGTTAFFDWKDWPGLAVAVMRWLAPEAGSDDKRPTGLDAAEAKRLVATLGQAADDAALGAGKPAKKGGKDRDADVALVERLLTAPPTAVDAKVLLDHVAGLGALPDALVYRLADWLRANPPADLAARRTAWLAGKEASLRFLALQLLADGADLRREMTAAVPPAEANRRLYALVLALPTVAGKELLDDGRTLVQQWNAEEAAVRDAWTGGKGFSVAAPEHPCLDAETLYRRLGWLAYLSRHDAAAHGAQFVREWLMTAVYQDFSGRSQHNRRPGDWDGLRSALGQLRHVARSEIERLRSSEPKVFAEGLAQTRYTREYLLARELLGEVPAAALKPVLEHLRSARHRDLAEFAAARLAGSGR